MNTYELTIVLDGRSAASKKKKTEESLDKLIKTFKGKIIESKDWGVKDLAYKINGSSTGLYLFYTLELEGDMVKALNDKLRTDTELLRYLLVRKEK